MFGVTPPWYKDPVEFMAFNLYAMEESRKDELREFAKQLFYGTVDAHTTQYLSQSETQFVMDEYCRLRNEYGGMYGSFKF